MDEKELKAVMQALVMHAQDRQDPDFGWMDLRVREVLDVIGDMKLGDLHEALDARVLR